MLGGSPSQLVWMITCTSEMSGSASSGIWLMDQIPARVSRTTPVKIKKRFCAQHSIIRETTVKYLLGHSWKQLARHPGEEERMRQPPPAIALRSQSGNLLT